MGQGKLKGPETNRAEQTNSTSTVLLPLQRGAGNHPLPPYQARKSEALPWATSLPGFRDATDFHKMKQPGTAL